MNHVVTNDDPLDLVEQLLDLSRVMPAGTVAAELATFGPLLNLIVGGRDGVPAYRDGVLLDDAEFIDLYRRVFESLLAEVPGGSALQRLVALAIQQDHRENANLLAAFDLLDPEDDSAPAVLGATRFAAPAAAHATAKFLLLAVPTVPALARYTVLRARSLVGGAV